VKEVETTPAQAANTNLNPGTSLINEASLFPQYEPVYETDEIYLA
jgi:hypothetical protein